MTAVGKPSPPMPKTPPQPMPPPRRSRVVSALKMLFTAALLAGAGAGGYLVYTDQVPKEVHEVVARLWPASQHSPAQTPAPKPRQVGVTNWNGLVDLDEPQMTSLGLRIVPVRAQTEPIKLELTGRTAYNENSLTKIRPRFDTLVEGVLVEKGRRVRKGEPLVELYSTQLATAKNNLQTNFVQWQHDLRYLKVREKLVKTGAISEQAYVDTLNDESKSRLDYVTARENLRVLGVPDSEIEPLTANLNDASTSDHLLNVADKAKMTLVSPVDGIVIQRDVVPGNLYDNDDVLLVIAPLDQLWVWANVFERDQAKVKLGQKMTIQFPFLETTYSGAVEFVASEVSKESRAVQIRASIPNQDGQLKADMLVRAVLDVPAVAGQTVIPRVSMVMLHGDPFVFVRSSAAAKEGEKSRSFERRRIAPAQENFDTVIVHDGLKAGEEVVSAGSIIVSQLYEDMQVVASGTPPE